jgi:hypothetical protein
MISIGFLWADDNLVYKVIDLIVKPSCNGPRYKSNIVFSLIDMKKKTKVISKILIV